MGCGGSSNASPASESERKFTDYYTIGEKLGEGVFGQVLVANLRSKSEELPRAVKVRDRSKLPPTRRTSKSSAPEDETRAWTKTSGHESVVEFFELFCEGSITYMVMEQCQCPVVERLESLPRVEPSKLADVVRGMLAGLGQAHSVQVVHRDVKPSNFFFGGPDGKVVKLADFVLAAEMPTKGLLRDFIGTVAYMCPQRAASKGYNVSTDIWSLGVATYILLFGEFPFGSDKKTNDGMKRAIKGCAPPKYAPSDPGLSSPSKAAAEFCRALLTRDPSMRPTVYEAMMLPFVAVMGSQSVAPPSGADPNDDVDLKPAICRAREVIAASNKKADPTVQRNLEDLLQRLAAEQTRGGPRPSLTRSFSGDNLRGNGETKGEEKEPQLVTRRTSKCSTHSGFISAVDAAALAALACDEDDGDGGDGGDSVLVGARASRQRQRAHTAGEQVPMSKEL